MTPRLPRSGIFWFVAQPGAEPQPARMAGLFAEKPANQKPSPDGYYQFPLYSDEVWPRVAAAFDFIGYRDQSYFPGGRVSCREDGGTSNFVSYTEKNGIFGMSRAITETFLTALQSGCLAKLTERIRNDDTLMLALRGSYVTRALSACASQPEINVGRNA
jgi:hypothetical protein